MTIFITKKGFDNTMHNGEWMKSIDPEELLKIRRKVWTFVVWPEMVGLLPYKELEDISHASNEKLKAGYKREFQREVKERLQEVILPSVISPVHDSDLKDDGSGEIAKMHLHVVTFFDQPQRLSFVLNYLKYNATFHKLAYIEPVVNVRSMMRYLCHLDQEAKQTYDVKDVVEVCGAQFEIEKETASELVVSAIMEEGLTSLGKVLTYFECNPSCRKWAMANVGVIRELCNEQMKYMRECSNYVPGSSYDDLKNVEREKSSKYSFPEVTDFM